MTALPISALRHVPAKLRSLSGFEHLFWAVDKVNGFNFAIAVSFRGSVAPARWRAAFAAVQKRHPFLNVAVNEDDPLAPFFASGAGLPISLAFQRRTSSIDWQRVMESEIAQLFDLSTAPLLRAVVLEDDAICDLVITAHHAVIDGIGVVAVIRDLLAALAGHALAALPVPPSAEHRAAQIRAANQWSVPEDAAEPAPWQADEAQPRNRTFVSRNRKGKCAITALRLSPDETARLLGYARRERTTIGAVLAAAAAEALRDLSPELKESDLRLTTALDARPYLSNQDDFVLSVISPRAIVSYPVANLFATARAIKSQIAPYQCFDAIEATFARVGAVLAQKFDAGTIVNLLSQGFGCDLLISNLKTVEFPALTGGLVAEAVWGPSVLVGIEGEHTIGSATFGGALHLVYSSFTPLPGFLEAVHEKLANACSAS